MTYLVQCFLSASDASMCPYVKWDQIEVNSENLCDAAQHTSWSFLAYLFCVEQGVDVCWGFFVDGYTLFFVVLYFKRLEAQT